MLSMPHAGACIAIGCHHETTGSAVTNTSVHRPRMARRFHSAASRNQAGEGAGAGPAGLRSPRMPCLENDLVRGAGLCLCVAA